MASLIQNHGRLVLAFVGMDGKRCWLSLGSNMPVDRAGTFKERIEDFVDARKRDRTPRPETLAWADRQTGRVRAVLLKGGLIDAPASTAKVTLGSWLTRYSEEHAAVKGTTAFNMRMAQENLLDFFGAEQVLEAVTAYDAERYRQSMKRPGANRLTKVKKALSEATIRRRCRYARQFFRAAMKARLIMENPFEDVSCGDIANESRQRFIDRPTTEAVLAACPDAQWRLLVALARYGGLRCPSEILALRWEDINWDKRRLTVRASKTEAYEAGGVRMVPMYSDSPLERLLLDVYSQAAEGERYVITRYRNPATNLRSQLLKVIRRAGMEPWPRLWQNLRRTREDELRDLGLPSDAVSYFQGHSAAVAQKHYLSKMREGWFEQATGATKAQHAGGRLSPTEPDGVKADTSPCSSNELQTAEYSGRA